MQKALIWRDKRWAGPWTHVYRVCLVCLKAKSFLFFWYFDSLQSMVLWITCIYLSLFNPSMIKFPSLFYEPLALNCFFPSYYLFLVTLFNVVGSLLLFTWIANLDLFLSISFSFILLLYFNFQLNSYISYCILFLLFTNLFYFLKNLQESRKEKQERLLVKVIFGMIYLICTYLFLVLKFIFDLTFI